MKNLTLSVLILLAPLACRAADEITPLDVKPGLWESTVTIQSSGMPGIPEETLAKLPPEQRARMEAAMKGMGGTHTARSCLTGETLRKPLAFGDSANSSCKRTIVSSSSGAMEFHVECSNDRMKSSGDGRVQAVSAESLKGETVMNSTMEGGRTTTTKVLFSSRWLGSDCGSVKPR